MTRRAAFTLGLSLGALAWLVLFACNPPPLPGEIPPASVDTAGELNAFMISHPITDLDGRTVDINGGPVTPPAGATLRNGRLVRNQPSTVRYRPHVEVTTDDVTLTGLTIVGDGEIGRLPDGSWVGGQPYMVYNPALESQHGISIKGAARTTIRDVDISLVWVRDLPG